MKHLKRLFIVALVAIGLMGCATPAHSKSYILKTEAEISPVSLNLNEKNQTFQIAFQSTKVLPYGKYTIEDGILTCLSLDKRYQFRFQVQDDETLIFIAEDSTPSIGDGEIFILEK